MPHKGPKCPKCGCKAKQIKFLEASPNISDEFVQRGWALFRCKNEKCRFEFRGHGIKRRTVLTILKEKKMRANH